MAFSGKAKADQSIGPAVYCSSSPTRIKPAPVTKPSLIFQSALNIDGEAVGIYIESAAADDEVCRRAEVKRIFR